MKRLTRYIAAVLVFAGAAAGYEEIVQNGGFETGALSPWTADNFEVVSGGYPGSHSGNYYSFMWYSGYTYEPLTGYIRQDLTRTYNPDEVRSAVLWLAPDPHIWSSGYDAYYIQYEFRLGDNVYSVPPPWWEHPWQKIEFPINQIQYPFNYIYVWVKVGIIAEPPPYNMQAGLDDISVLISPSAVSPASFGRIKALFR